MLFVAGWYRQTRLCNSQETLKRNLVLWLLTSQQWMLIIALWPFTATLTTYTHLDTWLAAGAWSTTTVQRLLLCDGIALC